MLKTSSGGQSALTDLEKKLTGRDPDDSVVPSPVRKSVRFMLSGAAVTVLSGLFSVIVVLSDPTVINSGKQPTSGQLTGDVVQVVLFTVVFSFLWVLMARFNRSGQMWARIVASVLFAISTYDLYSAISSLSDTGETIIHVYNIISFVLELAEWICGVGAVALLWRQESSVYFRERSGRR
ncbi:MAG TPA: hypothetical protein VIZ43_01915 [Trebonia sp.]